MVSYIIPPPCKLSFLLSCNQLQNIFGPEVEHLHCREHREAHAQPQEAPDVADDVQHAIQLVPLICHEVKMAVIIVININGYLINKQAGAKLGQAQLKLTLL